MRKSAVDYRGFRLRRLHEPQFSHLKLLFGWIVYFAFFFLTETLIPPEKCHVIHCPWDDRIPFNEYFIIPYNFWYLLIVISLGYFALYNVDNFRNLQVFFIITQAVAMTVYILYPSRQDLRPDSFPRDNLLTRYIALLYTVDTNTGVCPSLHAAYSLGMGSCWLKEPSASRLWKGFVLFWVVMICLSTVFVKQHSLVDVFAAMALGLLAETIVFGRKYWLPKFRKQPPE